MVLRLIAIPTENGDPNIGPFILRLELESNLNYDISMELKWKNIISSPN